MLTFFSGFSLAYIATTLGVTGLYHLIGWRSFRDTVRRHRIVPERAAGGLAALVVAVEWLITPFSAAGLAVGAPTHRAAYLAAAGAAGLAALFILYLLRLLGSPAGDAGCGCSPFSGETTRLSLIPAGGLALAGLLGLAGMAGGGAASARYAYGELGTLGLLAAGWGVTLAALALLSPEALRVDARKEPAWTA